MAGVLFFQLIINAVIFSFIFWALTFFAKFTYSNKYTNHKLNYYECGFKNLTNNKPKYELNFVAMLLFIVIYDGEFLLLIPFSLNISLFSIEVFSAIAFFFLWFILVIMFDYFHLILEWQVSDMFYNQYAFNVV